MIHQLSDFAPQDVEAGVGLALRDEQSRFLFFLAGTRHRCPPGELFYAGIGGHREPAESWEETAKREAIEEIGVTVALHSANCTWYLPHDRRMQPVDLLDRPRPLALYEMIHPPGTPRAGQLYRIVIYNAALTHPPQRLQADEVQGVIALTRAQVIAGGKRRLTLGEVLSGGGAVVTAVREFPADLTLYPLGTAAALAQIFAALSLEEGG